jgi:hypothetical protein
LLVENERARERKERERERGWEIVWIRVGVYCLRGVELWDYALI